MSAENNLTQSELKSSWSDYYACEKPFCPGCLEQRIPKEEYKFCSQERAPLTILDEWRKKVVAVFENVYACQVYHWTIYQGENQRKLAAN